MAICFVQGFKVNIEHGARYMYEPYFLPVLNLVRESPNKLVTFAHMTAVQYLSAVVGDKFFFLTKDREDFIKLGQTLPSQGYDKFLYICLGYYHSCFESVDPPETLEFNVKDQAFKMEFSEIEKFNIREGFILYEVSISESLVNTDRAAEPRNPTVQVR